MIEMPQKEEELNRLYAILDKREESEEIELEGKYIKSIQERLHGVSKEAQQITTITSGYHDDELLKPTVVIYGGKKKKETKKKEPTEAPAKEEDLFEVEKLSDEELTALKSKAKKTIEKEFPVTKGMQLEMEEESIEAVKEPEEKTTIEEPIEKTEESVEVIPEKVEKIEEVPLEEGVEEVEEKVLVEEEPIKEEKKETPKEEIKEEPSEEIKEEAPIFEPELSKEEFIKVLTEIKGIGKKKAEMLYESGFTSLQKIIDAELEDLAKVKGMNKKFAEQFKKEVMELQPKIAREFDQVYILEEETEEEKRQIEKKVSEEELEFKEEIPEWVTIDKSPIDEELPEWKAVEEEGYKYEDYTLYKVSRRGLRGKKYTYIFSKTPIKGGKPCQIPDGYVVKVKKGVPSLEKVK